jgi:protein-S-isoprenylcysteine O-methyltransferase Ste14
VALFAAFAVHHSVFARPRVKAWMRSLAPERLHRSIYVWTASLLFLLVCASWAPIGGDLYDVNGWRAYAHAGVQLAGIGIIATAVRRIDPLELAGIHRSTQALQITGPYRWVRHPVYLGWIMAVFAAAHMTADRLLFAAISSFYLAIAVPWEERALERDFPGEYAAYRQRVRWRIVPYVY